jgi:sugar phosphate isomerase/epimerase
MNMKYFISASLCLLYLQTMAQNNAGVQLYSFREQFKKDIPSTVKKINEMGITAVEGGDSYGMPAEAFRDLLHQNNIRVVSIGADYNELQNQPEQVIARAKLYGADYVVCFWIPHQAEQLTVAEADAGAAVFNKAGAILKAAGLSLCYHPHGYEFAPAEGETVFDYFLRKTDPASCNIEMDVFWIKQPGQDPLALMRKYPQRIKLMHLKDRKIGTPDSNNGRADVESNVTLGEGDVGIAAIVREARRMKIPYLFIEDESSRSMEQVPKSLSFIKAVK